MSKKKNRTLKEEIKSTTIKTIVGTIVGLIMASIISIVIAYMVLPTKVEANEANINKLQKDISTIQTDIGYLRGGMEILLKK